MTLVLLRFSLRTPPQTSIAKADVFVDEELCLGDDVCQRGKSLHGHREPGLGIFTFESILCLASLGYSTYTCPVLLKSRRMG